MTETETEPETVTATACRTHTSTVLLEQHARYDYSNPVTNLRRALCSCHPPPRRTAAVAWRLAVEGVDRYGVEARADPFGNLILEVAVPRVESWVDFTVETEVRTAEGNGAHRMRPDRRYLSPTHLTAPDDRIATLAEGPADAALLCARVHAAFRYEWGITGVHTTAGEALAGGRGVCQDYAHVMLSACRLAGLPARYVSGHLLGEGGSHAWVEVLSAEPHRSNTWMVEAWDPTHDRRAGHGYLTVAVGRDYADVAPMSGTFDHDGDGDGVIGTLTARKRTTVV